LGNKFTYLAQTGLFTHGISTTDVVKHLFKSDQNLFIFICSFQSQFRYLVNLSIIAMNVVYLVLQI